MSSNSEYSPTFDFIIWGMIAFVFMVMPYLSVPLKHLIGRICRYLGLSSDYQQDTNEVDSDGRPLNREYSSLPDSAKNQIHEIRAREISNRLADFSMELSAENMITRHHDEDGHDNDDLSNKEECDTSLETSDEESQPRAAPNDDIEAPVEFSNSDEAIYTHICLPLPGYNKNGMRKPKKKPTIRSSTQNKRMMGLALFRRERKDDSKQAKALSDVDDSAKVMEENSIQQKDDRREVPIFCAICLGEYETSERVCWSSNTECTHVFHHDCMLQWLKSLGKRACKMQRFSENPSVNQVMNFATECPCCRQSFIDKSVDVGVDEDDENV
mmetsp:Transcript_14987/g.24554  ORF Transcript_14987/g.24554 Transcript_14987/m.24554 type:complete len:327 (+) Transcript_14987:220-1200(+)